MHQALWEFKKKLLDGDGLSNYTSLEECIELRCHPEFPRVTKAVLAPVFNLFDKHLITLTPLQSTMETIIELVKASIKDYDGGCSALIHAEDLAYPIISSHDTT